MKDINEDEHINKRVITDLFAETICHKTLFCVNLQFIYPSKTFLVNECYVIKYCIIFFYKVIFHLLIYCVHVQHT